MLEQEHVAHGLLAAFHPGQGGGGIADLLPEFGKRDVGRAAGSSDDRADVAAGEGVTHGR
ncbi:hypothetical protein ACFYYR_09125 [Streptomyces sp. NPDC001922]|uniref:hypothetical protein n=1 Tax=Streptomyces sp. NPDC001922 TaxID=3364624 RepID=UPI00369DC813